MYTFIVTLTRWDSFKSERRFAEWPVDAENFMDAVSRARLMLISAASSDLNREYEIHCVQQEGSRGLRCFAGWETTQEEVERLCLHDTP